MPHPPLRSVVRQFWGHISGGRSAAEAGVAAGVSERSGLRWFADAGGVKPRLCEPKLSGPRPRLTFEDRIEIEFGVRTNESLRSMGARLGRPASTIKREIDANGVRNRYDGRKSGYRRKEAFGARRSGNTAQVAYRALVAQARADDRARRPKPAKLAGNDRLRDEVQTRLDEFHSPGQIAAMLRRDFPDDPEMWVSHEAIYQAVYVQGRGHLRRDIHRCLRTGRAVRKPRTHPGERRGRIPDMVNISERPPEVADRAVPGHWEGDLILGSTESGSAIGTLVERSTRFALLLHLPDNHGAQAVQDAIVAKMAQLPPILRRTLTWDQGKEMTNHIAIAAATELDIYFCDPHSPWQRGTNENTNGLLRQWFAKGTDLSVFPADYLDYVATKLNNRPRQTLDWKTPAEALDELLSHPTGPSTVASIA
ncbi:IS30 family transposase [Mycobacterium simiae]|uniref:IS30 family transposase n=1 Tax=Mycobacterium simiae TaxID=1784 RepID=A0A1X0XVZ0_MYCSI|nr:IS30 family transposase [Mycobacterium simiae]ORJ57043.1 IS30 family transposase [Mycobacterium simiae]ORJ57249.1 IS30 family transposase [Mycobacterium simiae]ORJ57793.1 IS30 family transposase [Mycobacterium simiae]ORJ61675.1 IS30 family transposase [Mycobacterium simiae]